MIPIIGFEQKKGGANNSSPEGKTSVISLSSKTLQATVNCSRSEALFSCDAPYSKKELRVVSHIAKTDADVPVLNVPFNLKPEYVFDAEQTKNDYLVAAYDKLASEMIDKAEAYNQFTSIYRDLIMTTPYRYIHTGSETELLTLTQLIGKAREKRVELNVKLSDKLTVTEAFVLTFENSRNMEDFIWYCSTYHLGFRLIRITDSHYNYRVVVILPAIYSISYATGLMYNFAEKFVCLYDHTLRIFDTDKVVPVTKKGAKA